MAIIVFQHCDIDGPGRIGTTFRDHGLKLDVRRPDVHGAAAIPPDLDNVNAVLVLGGPQNVGEGHVWMEPELEYIRRAHALQLPVIGVCLGAQMIAAALGGTVGPLERGVEWGFHPVTLNAAGQIEPMLSGILWNSMQFQSHGQEVKQLPEGAVNFASSPLCKHQAFRAGLRTYGFQYHFECDRPMIEAFITDSADSLARAGLTAGDVAAQADRHYPEFARLADRLCVNLVTYLFPFEKRLKQ